MAGKKSAEAFLDAFAQAIIARAFGRAEAMLAPWVRNALPDGGLKELVRLALGDAPPVTEFTMSAVPHEHPASMRESVDENAAEEGGRTLATADGTIAALGPPSFPIPDEITDANFQGSWRIEFQPVEDLESDVDYSFALYVTVVTDADDSVVGYVEPMD